MKCSWHALFMLVAALVTATAACSDEPNNTTVAPSDSEPDTPTPEPDDTPDPMPDDDPNPDTPTPDPEPAPIVWEACPLIQGASPLESNPEAQCASVPVPLNWDNPEGTKVDLYVKRFDPPNEPLIDIWMVNGGPGGASNTFERLARGLGPAWGNVRIFLTDARGAGNSSRLGCPSAESEDSPGGFSILNEEWDGCLAEVHETWGAENMVHFGTTAAATDLIHLSEQTRLDGVSQFIYGVSYGTFWVHRALQIDPNAWDGVILDSIVPADKPDLAFIDAWHDEVVRELFAFCPDDEDCRAALGEDAVAATEELFEMFDAGHCPELGQEDITGRTFLRVVFGALVSSTTARGIIPAMVHRARRCNEEDVDILINIIESILGRAGEPVPLSSRLFSVVLSRQVVFSEMWGEAPPSGEELVMISDAALASKDIGRFFGAAYESWPRHALDDHAGKWAETDTPILMFNGTLDPQTPLETAIAAAEVFDGPNQTFITMPGISHGAAFSSIVRGGQTTCGILTMTQFMRNPEAEIDASCVDDLSAENLNVPANLAEFFFGTTDIYGFE